MTKVLSIILKQTPRARVFLIGFGFILIALFFFIRGFFYGLHNNATFHIGQDPQWYPANLLTKEKNVTAFSDDLLKAIAEKEGFYFYLSNTSSNLLLNKLDKNEFDAVLSATQPTFQNQLSYLFSKPYFLTGPVLIIQAPRYKKTADEEFKIPKLIGVTADLANLLALEHDPQIQLKIYDNILKTLVDLDEGHIDGAIFPAFPAYIYTKTFYPDRLIIATSPLTNEGLHLITLKTPRGEQLIEKFNKGLDELKESNTYDFFITKWGLINPEKVDEAPSAK